MKTAGNPTRSLVIAASLTAAFCCGALSQGVIPAEHYHKSPFTIKFESALPTAIQQHVAALELAACGQDHPRIDAFNGELPDYSLSMPLAPGQRPKFDGLLDNAPTAVLEVTATIVGATQVAAGPSLVAPVYIHVDSVVGLLLGFPPNAAEGDIPLSVLGGVGMLDGRCTETAAPGLLLMAGHHYLLFVHYQPGRNRTAGTIYGSHWFEMQPNGSAVALQLPTEFDLGDIKSFEVKFLNWADAYIASQHDGSGQ